ncbi:16S rRNA (cytidine(1402)-2'-O)-methyltransferase [Metallibacterium sp.]|jgi:16S rRNA (cytidine1402-2'-O)-methyltransferase|uniref:16S rRNA (cytidine(1402)-2'-O)-methyltransferase n=1 Tax=Metallibacterium sp. TaxID=2940281 RepID=UPI00260335E2|nr:16S rRNA (cytidine(1402)-2'-O)-methyltransferase [Metallibacterium sp.]
MATASGTLWVVATPIGNLDDLSARARSVLGSVVVIAAEDTRHTRHLLQHFGLATPLLALHEHNEAGVVAALLARLAAGEDLALVSDAGTPLISDPGFRLVRAARAAGLRVAPVPGPAALIAALSVAGLPSERFVFEGFLPAKAGARRQHLAALVGEARTLVFYEAPHRLEATLADLAAAFGSERPAALARELTKLHETVIDATLGDLMARVAADADQRRGEIVLIVGGNDAQAAQALAEGRRLYALLRGELAPARAARIAAEFTGASRRALYAESNATDTNA